MTPLRPRCPIGPLLAGAARPFQRCDQVGLSRTHPDQLPQGGTGFQPVSFSFPKVIFTGVAMNLGQPPGMKKPRPCRPGASRSCCWIFCAADFQVCCLASRSAGPTRRPSAQWAPANRTNNLGRHGRSWRACPRAAPERARPRAQQPRAGADGGVLPMIIRRRTFLCPGRAHSGRDRLFATKRQAEVRGSLCGKCLCLSRLQ